MKKEQLILLAAGLLVLTGALAWGRWEEAHPPQPTAEQKAHVEIVPEQVLFNNWDVRVLISAHIRPTAKIDRINFVHVGGYFVDQTGTSYSPGFTRVNNRGLPTLDEIGKADYHLLRTGEIYRYCLGPARIDVDHTSEEAAASTIKKVTVYLEGLPPTDVPVKRWRGLDPTSNNPKDWQ